MIKENKETCQKGVIAQGFAGSGKKICFWQVFSYKNPVDTGLIFISDFFNSNFFDEPFGDGYCIPCDFSAYRQGSCLINGNRKIDLAVDLSDFHAALVGPDIFYAVLCGGAFIFVAEKL